MICLYNGKILFDLAFQNILIMSLDINDLVINDEQMPLLKDLKSKTSENYIWVTDEVIQTLGHETGSKSFPHEIGPHTKYAQNLKWSK